MIWRIPHQAEALQGGGGWDCQNTFPFLQGFMILSLIFAKFSNILKI